MTEDHVKLARRMYTDWDRAEYGAPCIDPKRPYGNSDVDRDIHEILGWALPEDEVACEQYLDGEGHDRARAIHVEMETALQVILRTGSFAPGNYKADNYDQNWRSVP